jgi:heavy metal translocating P-type ATPase
LTFYGPAKFCCAGCESVFELLQSCGLSHFYELRDQFTFGAPEPVEIAPNNAVAPLGGRALFYLEGIHCLGCLWLLEKLPEMQPGVSSSTLDLSHQILEIEIDPARITWPEVTGLISRLGYRAAALEAEGSDGIIQSDQRRQLVRVGISAFCSGNIMLLAVCTYAGADAAWVARFAWLSFALALPVLGYAAWPIYRAALMPLRKKRISVDLAIALALLTGTAASLWSVFTEGGRQTYFDSLTMLVFLLLSSRLFLNRVRESFAKEKPYLSFLSSERYERLRPNPGLVGAAEICAGDVFALIPGQTLPVDCTALSAAYFDLSLLSGESAPLKFLSGDSVEAGARLLGESVNARASRTASRSRLALILEQVRAFQLQRSPTIDFADRMGRYFVITVLVLAAGTWTLHFHSDGFRRALALVIVTCPCILAFAVPLTLVRGMQRAARLGILFRDPGRLEALASVQTAFLDKTGTLTMGNFQVLCWEQVDGDQEENLAVAASLEATSSHPVGKAIARYCHDASRRLTESLHQLPGEGVEGRVNGVRWAIRKLGEVCASNENRVGIFREGCLHARVSLGDANRADSAAAVAALGTLGLRAVLLSGDSQGNVAESARANGIREWHSSLSPEAKAAIVAREPLSAMVGDGANDSVAFQAASVGVAVQGAVELSLRNADVALTRPGLGGLVDAVRIAQDTMRLVRANFRFTLFYNFIAGTLAIAGHMSPLIAAVLMPMSALTVFGFTQWRTGAGAR